MLLLRLILAIFFACCLQDAGADQEKWIKGFPIQREFESKPPAFEKIYVTRDVILSMQDGIYLKHSCGNLQKVRCLRHDCEGMYVLLIETQCPLCGACYSGKEPPEGMCCPMFEVQTRQNVWIKP